MKKLLLPGIVLLFSLSSFAQTIQSIDVLPNSPISTDNISITVDYMFTSGPCDLVHQFFSITGNDIYTYHYHCPGMLTVICYGTDVISIGQLAPGNYTANVNLFEGTYDSLGNCNQFVQSDISAHNFVVSLGTGVDQIKNTRPIVFFNKEVIKISNLNTNYQFVLIDVRGKEILSREVSASENIFSISAEAGVYFYSLRKEGMQEFTGKLIFEK